MKMIIGVLLSLAVMTGAYAAEGMINVKSAHGVTATMDKLQARRETSAKLM